MSYLKFLAIILVLLVVSAEANTAARPNVIIVLLDDLGFSDFGYLGGDIQTPHIDALARDGLTITNFYAHPRCSPSRAALLIGRYPH